MNEIFVSSNGGTAGKTGVEEVKPIGEALCVPSSTLGEDEGLPPEGCNPYTLSPESIAAIDSLWLEPVGIPDIGKPDGRYAGMPVRLIPIPKIVDVTEKK